jgi:HIV Tat-specific factor 1
MDSNTNEIPNNNNNNDQLLLLLHPPPPPPTTNNNYYFYLTSTGDRRGPTSLTAMKALSRINEILPETLCWTTGLENWIPYQELINNIIYHHDEPILTATTTTTTESSSNITTQQPTSKKQSHNTSIYVSNLPPNISKSDLVQYFSKCGLFKKDLLTLEEKIKIYVDDEGNPKGDALITFLNPASVELAIQLLDDTEIKPGYKIHVEEPNFQSSNTTTSSSSNNNTNTTKRIKTDKEKIDKVVKVRKMQERLALGWSDGIGPTKETALCIVVLKNLFDPNELAKLGEQGVKELEQDIAAGLEDCKGEIKKVTVFTKHVDGVCLVRFVDPVDAEECVRIMRGRWFDGRKIDAALWDGITQYAPAVTSDDVEERKQKEQQRLDEFADWIESGDTVQENDEITTVISGSQ